MPYPTHNNAGGIDAFNAGDLPVNKAHVVWCLEDALLMTDRADLFPSLTSNRKNPPGEDPTRPMVNVVTPQPQEVAAFSDVWTFSNGTTDFGMPLVTVGKGNDVLQINVTDFDLTPSGDVTFLTTEAARAHVEGILQAVDAGFTVTVVDGFWTFSHPTVPFSLGNVSPSANEAITSFGFKDDFYASSLSHTGDARARHTWAFAIMRLSPSLFHRDASVATSLYRFATFVGLNYHGNRVNGTAIPTPPRLRLYFANDADDLDFKPDSGFSEGEDLFTLGEGPDASPWKYMLANREGVGGATRLSHVLKNNQLHYYRAFDIGGARRDAGFTGALADPGYPFVKLTIFDPERPSEATTAGRLYFSRGFHPTRNTSFGTPFGSVDGSRVATTVTGGALGSYAMPHYQAEYGFADGNPLSHGDQSILRTHYHDATVEGSFDQLSAPADVALIAGQHRPVVIFDPQLSKPKLASAASSADLNRLEGARYGYLVADGLPSAIMPGLRYAAQFRFREVR